MLVDDREKAISWNRLGKVYRQLKDYQQAVIAFQQADELNPECKEDGDEPGQMLYASSDLSDFMQKYSGSLADLKEVAASDIDQVPAAPTPEMIIDTTSPETMMDTPAPEMIIETTSPETMMDTPAPEMIIETTGPETMIDIPIPEIIADAATFTDLAQPDEDIPVEF